jgi:hypothetical protein
MSEWLTITIQESGLSQRARKSSISSYGTTQNSLVYIVKDGRMIYVTQTLKELEEELEEQ